MIVNSEIKCKLNAMLGVNLLLHHDFSFSVTSTPIQIQNALWCELNLNNNIWDFVRKTWIYFFKFKTEEIKWVAHEIKSIFLSLLESHTKNPFHPLKKWCFKLCLCYHNIG